MFDKMINHCIFSSILDSKNLVCPDRVTKFSIGVRSPNYYECTEVGKKPILKTCRKGKIYHPKKQRCESVNLQTEKFQSMKKSTLLHKREQEFDDLEMFETNVLGRIVHIGDLYDAKKSDVLAGVSLWNDDTIKKYTRRSKLPSVRTRFFAAESSFERLDNMDIDAELKLDFLGKKVLPVLLNTFSFKMFFVLFSVHIIEILARAK